MWPVGLYFRSCPSLQRCCWKIMLLSLHPNIIVHVENVVSLFSSPSTKYKSVAAIFVTPANFPHAVTVRKIANDITLPIHLRVQSMIRGVCEGFKGHSTPLPRWCWGRERGGLLWSTRIWRRRWSIAEQETVITRLSSGEPCVLTTSLKVHTLTLSLSLSLSHTHTHTHTHTLSLSHTHMLYITNTNTHHIMCANLLAIHIYTQFMLQYIHIDTLC